MGDFSYRKCIFEHDLGNMTKQHYTYFNCTSRICDVLQDHMQTYYAGVDFIQGSSETVGLWCVHYVGLIRRPVGSKHRWMAETSKSGKWGGGEWGVQT